MRDLKSKLSRINKAKLIPAVVLDALGDRVSVQIVGNGKKLTGIGYVGGPFFKGEQIFVDYSSGQPVAYTGTVGTPTKVTRTVTAKRVFADSSAGLIGSTGEVSDHRFLDHVDTPDAYTGHADKLLTVLPDEDGVYFKDFSAISRKVVRYDAATTDVYEYDATGDGLVAALAAASSGDFVSFPNGDYVCDLVIPAGVTVGGLTLFGCTIHGQITIGDGATISNFTLSIDSDDSGIVVGILGPTSGVGTVYDFVAVINNSVGGAYGIQQRGAGRIYVGRVSLQVNTTGTGYGVYIDPTGSERVDVRSGAISGTTAPSNESGDRLRTYAVEIDTSEPHGVTLPGDLAPHDIEGGGSGGATTFLGLTDTPESYSGQAGKVAVVNTAESGLEFAAVSGGGTPTAIYTKWDSDAPPESPSAYDDEFNDGTIDAKWGVYDRLGTTLAKAEEYGLLRLSSNSVVREVAGLYQTLPSGDFTISSKMGISAPHISYFIAGISLYENPTDYTKKSAFAGMLFRNGDYTTVSAFYNNYNSWGGTSREVGCGSAAENMIYVRYRRNATNYYVDISIDGISWIQWSNFTLAWTPTAMGVLIDRTAVTAVGKVNFEFWRYQNTDVGQYALLSGRTMNVY